MDKKWLKIGGAVGIVGGSIALFLSGAGEGMATAIVGAAFVLAGVIAALFKS